MKLVPAKIALRAVAEEVAVSMVRVVNSVAVVVAAAVVDTAMIVATTAVVVAAVAAVDAATLAVAKICKQVFHSRHPLEIAGVFFYRHETHRLRNPSISVWVMA